MLQTSVHRAAQRFHFRVLGSLVFTSSPFLSQDKSDVQTCVNASDWRATDEHVCRKMHPGTQPFDSWVFHLIFLWNQHIASTLKKYQVTEILIAAVRKDVYVPMFLNTKEALRTNQVKRKYLQGVFLKVTKTCPVVGKWGYFHKGFQLWEQRVREILSM